jgi:hypothetical protein
LVQCGHRRKLVEEAKDVRSGEWEETEKQRLVYNVEEGGKKGKAIFCIKFCVFYTHMEFL